MDLDRKMCQMNIPPQDDDPAIMDQAELNIERLNMTRLDLAGLEVTHDHLLGAGVAVTQPTDGFRVGTDAVLLNAAVLKIVDGCWIWAPALAGLHYVLPTGLIGCR